MSRPLEPGDSIIDRPSNRTRPHQKATLYLKASIECGFNYAQISIAIPPTAHIIACLHLFLVYTSKTNFAMAAVPPMTLDMLVARKHQLESDLKQLEKHIFDLETVYLEEPGNITNNWEASTLSSESIEH